MGYVRGGRPQWFTEAEGGTISSAMGNLQAKINSARTSTLSAAAALWRKVVKDSATMAPPASDNSLFSNIVDKAGVSTLLFGWYNYTGSQYKARDRFRLRVTMFKDAVIDLIKNEFGNLINKPVGGFTASTGGNKFLRKKAVDIGKATVPMTAQSVARKTGSGNWVRFVKK